MTDDLSSGAGGHVQDLEARVLEKVGLDLVLVLGIGKTRVGGLNLLGGLVGRGHVDIVGGSRDGGLSLGHCASERSGGNRKCFFLFEGVCV